MHGMWGGSYVGLPEFDRVGLRPRATRAVAAFMNRSGTTEQRKLFVDAQLIATNLTI